MAVIDPVLLEITGLEKTDTIEVPNFPKDETKGKHPILVSGKVFVDRSDVREEDSPNFYGIAPGKRVGLKYSHIVNITGIHKEDGKIVRVTATIDADVL
jgi:glutaminyl-tRNA synthetase